MKSYTDTEQSEKLAKILPIDSADMWWSYFYNVISDTGRYNKEPMLHKPICDSNKVIPCWSLAALLDVIPEVHDNKPAIFLNDNSIIYPYVGDLYVKADNLIDACYEMILKLHELKML